MSHPPIDIDKIKKIAEDLIACEVGIIEFYKTFDKKDETTVLMGFVSIGYSIRGFSGNGQYHYVLKSGSITANLYFK